MFKSLDKFNLDLSQSNTWIRLQYLIKLLSIIVKCAIKIVLKIQYHFTDLFLLVGR